MKKENATLLLVDDHGLILQGLRRVIERISGIASVNTAQTGTEAGRLIASCKYDIYVLDVELSDMNGIELVQQIRQKDKDAYIIINTMHEEIWIIRSLLQNGVNSIVLKSSDINEIKRAILAAQEGINYFCPRFENINHKIRDSEGHILRGEIPTPRELDVLIAIASGDNTAEIADKLNISTNTVETFRKRLMAKFSARNAVDLVMKAIEKGYISIRSGVQPPL